VVAESNTPDTLAFFGVAVRTTTAQIFLTGAICTWALLAAAWLLAAGIRRSRERGEQLTLLRGRAVDRGDGTACAEPAGLADPRELAGAKHTAGIFCFCGRDPDEVGQTGRRLWGTGRSD